MVQIYHGSIIKPKVFNGKGWHVSCGTESGIIDPFLTAERDTQEKKEDYSIGFYILKLLLFRAVFHPVMNSSIDQYKYIFQYKSRLQKYTVRPIHSLVAPVEQVLCCTALYDSTKAKHASRKIRAYLVVQGCQLDQLSWVQGRERVREGWNAAEEGQD